MCSIADFCAPPTANQVTICETEGCFIVSAPNNTDIRNYTDNTDRYPSVTINQDALRPTASSSRESAKSAFIQRNSTLWKRLYQTWFEHGFGGILRELGTLQETNNGCAKLIAKLAQNIAPLYDRLSLWHIFPQLTLPDDFKPTQNGENNCRAFAWHPNTLKFAVAQSDDTVRVFNSCSGKVNPFLKHKLQKDIADMAWKPFSASVLALACQSGVIVWVLDPTSLVTRPSSTCMTLLARKGHVNVTSISWHPYKDLLVSGSPCDSSMLVWDVSQEVATPLQRLSGGGVSLVRWCPSGTRLFSGTPSTLFRVWETNNWTCEKWTKLSSRCQTCCWSPDGGYLLFATKDEPVIYCLSFQDAAHIEAFSVGGAKNAIPVADVRQIVTDRNPQMAIGGPIRNIVWDKTGERLAVSFVDGDLITVFRTRLTPNFDISPCGFVRYCSQVPQLMSFHDDFKAGALLTICWSNGMIRHVPMLFVPCQTSPANALLNNTVQHSFTNGSMRRQLFTTP